MKKLFILLFTVYSYSLKAQTDVHYLRARDSINLGGQVFKNTDIIKWNSGSHDSLNGTSAQFVKGDGSLDNIAYAYWDNVNSVLAIGPDAGFGVTRPSWGGLDCIFIGNQAGAGANNVNGATYIGAYSGNYARSAFGSNFVGWGTGYRAENAYSSNFFGNAAGFLAINANSANFFGENTGSNATNANNSNFIGSSAGQGAINASYSNFFGNYAGNNATAASNSNFFGENAGNNASSADLSNLFGYQAGQNNGSVGIGSNNIIIGTNISMADNTANAINIGGVIFGTGTYSDINTQSIAAVSAGKVGIGIVNPATTLDVNGTTQASQFKLSALNTAPSSSSDTGSTGEIRIVNGFIYVCVANNTWQRTTLSTF